MITNNESLYSSCFNNQTLARLECRAVDTVNTDLDINFLQELRKIHSASNALMHDTLASKMRFGEIAAKINYLITSLLLDAVEARVLGV